MSKEHEIIINGIKYRTFIFKDHGCSCEKCALEELNAGNRKCIFSNFVCLPDRNSDNEFRHWKKVGHELRDKKTGRFIKARPEDIDFNPQLFLNQFGAFVKRIKKLTDSFKI